MGEWISVTNDIPADALSTGGLIERTWKPAKGVLVLCADGHVSAAYWDEYYAEGGMGYDPEQTAWIEPCSGEQLTLHYDEPTHWMPLPEPPDSRKSPASGYNVVREA